MNSTQKKRMDDRLTSLKRKTTFHFISWSFHSQFSIDLLGIYIFQTASHAFDRFDDAMNVCYSHTGVITRSTNSLFLECFLSRNRHKFSSFYSFLLLLMLILGLLLQSISSHNHQLNRIHGLDWTEHDLLLLFILFRRLSFDLRTTWTQLDLLHPSQLSIQSALQFVFLARQFLQQLCNFRYHPLQLFLRIWVDGNNRFLVISSKLLWKFICWVWYNFSSHSF